MDLNTEQKRKLLSFLSGFISENKKARFDEIIPYRTRYITLVLEDIFQPHNASAVLRSCDCFGIQDIHIIENANKYEINPDVALGSAKWLSIYKYNALKNNTRACLQHLKESGYTIVATSPHTEEYTPENLSFDHKIALVFGTELKGLSPQAIRMADSYIKIPMYGFTESLNISVSAALLIRTLSERLRKYGIDWHLTEEENLDVRIAWTKSVLKKADILEKEFLRKIIQ